MTYKELRNLEDFEDYKRYQQGIMKFNRLKDLKGGRLSQEDRSELKFLENGAKFLLEGRLTSRRITEYLDLPMDCDLGRDTLVELLNNKAHKTRYKKISS